MTGEVQTPAGRVLLIDDYAHHPREIAPTLAAVRAGWPGRRLVVAFQPHRYTRTHDLFDDFTQVLSGVDALILSEIYPAGESPISGADGRALCRGIRARGHVDPVFLDNIADLPAALQDILQDGDVLLTMGAGDIGAVAARLADALRVRGDAE
jgi:UDP-N-acetylmuramate--alanine ligase